MLYSLIDDSNALASTAQFYTSCQSAFYFIWIHTKFEIFAPSAPASELGYSECTYR